MYTDVHSYTICKHLLCVFLRTNKIALLFHGNSQSVIKCPTTFIHHGGCARASAKSSLQLFLIFSSWLMVDFTSRRTRMHSRCARTLRSKLLPTGDARTHAHTHARARRGVHGSSVTARGILPRGRR